MLSGVTVTEAIHRSGLLDDLVDQATPLFRFREVGLEIPEPPPRRFDQPSRFVRLAVLRDAGDVRARLGQSPGHRLSETATTTGDNSDSAIQFEEIENHDAAMMARGLTKGNARSRPVAPRQDCRRQVD